MKYSPRSAVLAGSATVLLLWVALFGNGTFWPLLAVACVPFFISICKGTARQALLTGLFVGIVHFLLLLYWIVSVLGQYGGLPLYLSVPALLLLCLYMAAYLVVFVLLTRLFVQRFDPLLALFLIPCAWVGLDWLRSFLFSGFPWMDLGYGLAGVPLLFQSADIWGHHGLTFLIIMLNTFFTQLILNRSEKKLVGQLAIPVSLVFIAATIYSGWRWQQLENGLEEAEFMNVAVVQGNIDQGQKWDPARRASTVMGYVEQSRSLMRKTPKPELLVWPETSLPFYPFQNLLLAPVIQLVIEEQVMLLTGSPWYERDSLQPENIQFFNSSLLFDTQGNIVARTSKSHLVPFGEYVPLKEFLPFIAPLVEAVGDFRPGQIRNPPACKKARIGVLICFESVFADISRKWVDEGANLLVNMTNDAWYGRSSAPYQTLAMTRLRAVETRRAIVRSANTGFSGFIDPMGRVHKLSPLFELWEAVQKVQIREDRTFFVRGGYLFAPVCFLLAFIGFVFVGKRKRMNQIR
ncbi:MAG TPA: apolipoprotein N-acyltransferase [Desulfobacterales bacterium]|nr:apolipoprotein N-acyltransferase [Desulfobacterales bacterium]HIP38957.1 apolipoprotein N-acyltransferase [Desulfocapsa sulfexigens]